MQNNLISALISSKDGDSLNVEILNTRASQKYDKYFSFFFSFYASILEVS